MISRLSYFVFKWGVGCCVAGWLLHAGWARTACDTYVWERFCYGQSFYASSEHPFPQFCVLYEASRKVLSASFSNLRQKTYQHLTSLFVSTVSSVGRTTFDRIKFVKGPFGFRKRKKEKTFYRKKERVEANSNSWQSQNRNAFFANFLLCQQFLW